MSSSDCSLIQPLLGAYLDGELPSDSAESLGRHLETCDPCRGVLTELAETDCLLRDVQPEFPTEPQWAAMEGRLLSRARTRAFRQVARAAAVAAAAVLLLAAIFWLATLLDRGAERTTPNGNPVTYQNEGLEEPDETPIRISVERG